jgi:RNA polymerase-binding transcription factor DksA
MSTSEVDNTLVSEDKPNAKEQEVFHKAGTSGSEQHTSTDPKQDVSQDVAAVDQVLKLLDTMQPSTVALLMSKLDLTMGSQSQSLGNSNAPPAPVQQQKPAALSGYVHSETPRLPFFSGDPANKGEVSYRQWRYEVKCLLTEHTWSEGVLMHAIRKSLRGMASDTLQNLGIQVTVSDVLSAFETTFGNVATADQLIENFYAAQQHSAESVTQWGCRLEVLAREASEAGAASSSGVLGMLRSKFFNGLITQSVKTAIRHLYTDKKIEYRELLRAARSAELELEGKPPSKAAKKDAASHMVQQQTGIEAKLDQLVLQIKSLEDRMKSVESGSSTYCYQCGDPSHIRRDCPQKGKNGKQGKKQTQRNPPAPHQPGAAPSQPINMYYPPGPAFNQRGPAPLQFGPTPYQVGPTPYPTLGPYGPAFQQQGAFASCPRSLGPAQVLQGLNLQTWPPWNPPPNQRQPQQPTQQNHLNY